MTLYDLFFFFVIYSFIGWVVEVIFQAVVKGKILNRGFLNGPVCPVYGFGMSAVLLLFYSINSENVFIIFLEGIILTTLIELIAGFILDKCFHARWWDYSKMPLNLNGYICVAFSIIWGLAVVFVVKIAHPALYRLTVANIPTKIGIPLLIVLYIFFITDTIITVMTLIGLNKKLKELDDISKRMRKVSDRLSTTIGENSLKTAQVVQESRVQAALAKAEAQEAYHEAQEDADTKLKELTDRYNTLRESLITNKHYGIGRIIHVFPNARHNIYKEVLNDLQERIRNNKRG